MFHGFSPCDNNQAVRDVSVCVFPLPGPAKIANVSAKEETAARCEALRFVRRSSEFMVRRVVGYSYPGSTRGLGFGFGLRSVGTDKELQ